MSYAPHTPAGYRYLAEFEKEEDAHQHVRGLALTYGEEIETIVLKKGIYQVWWAIYVKQDHFDYIIRKLINDAVRHNAVCDHVKKNQEKPKTKKLILTYTDEEGKENKFQYEIIPGKFFIEESEDEIEICLS